ncbi:Protein ENOL-1 b, partial [Aphelenchoides avenae]
LVQVPGVDLHPARRRRPHRHQPEAHQDRHREEGLQLPPPQGEPNRLRDRVDRGGEALSRQRLGRDGLAPLRRDRGHLHRGPRRWSCHRT